MPSVYILFVLATLYYVVLRLNGKENTFGEVIIKCVYMLLPG